MAVRNDDKRVAATPSRPSGSGGGRGGSVPVGTRSGGDGTSGSGTEVQNPATTTTQYSGDVGGRSTLTIRRSGKDALREVLVTEGIFLLSPRKFRETVDNLHAGGITDDDVRSLADYLRASTDSEVQVRKVLASALCDAGTMTESMDRVREWLRRADTGRRNSMLSIYRDRPQVEEGEDPAQWMHDRNARIAYCRVTADRRDAAGVAAELGVTADEVADLIERGRVLLTPDDALCAGRMAESGETPEERVQRFIKTMSAKRARRKA